MSDEGDGVGWKPGWPPEFVDGQTYTYREIEEFTWNRNRRFQPKPQADTLYRLGV